MCDQERSQAGFLQADVEQAVFSAALGDGAQQQVGEIFFRFRLKKLTSDLIKQSLLVFLSNQVGEAGRNQV